MGLKESMAALCDEIKRGEEQRFSDVKQIKETAGRMIAEFRNERRAIAKALSVKLRNERSQRQKMLTEALGVWQKFTNRAITVPKRPTMRGAAKPSSSAVTVATTPPETIEEPTEGAEEVESTAGKIMAVISWEEDGLTFDEFKETSKISASRLGKTLRKLVKEGKIEKRAEKYCKVAR